MRELITKDLWWILRRAPKQVISLMKDHSGLLLAGGFIRACVANEEASDLDLFAPDEERAGLYSRILAGNHGKIFKSKNAFTIRAPEYTIPIQIIHRWTYTKPEELIESFDYTVAKSVIWCSRNRDETKHDNIWHSLIHDDFYPDLAAKRLTYTKPQRNEDAGGSLLRVLKFYQKGYRIPLDSMAAVVARLMMMGVKEEEINGFAANQKLSKEDALGQVITGLLHEVDPLQDPEHIYHLPSLSEPVDASQ